MACRGTWRRECASGSRRCRSGAGCVGAASVMGRLVPRLSCCGWWRYRKKKSARSGDRCRRVGGGTRRARLRGDTRRDPRGGGSGFGAARRTHSTARLPSRWLRHLVSRRLRRSRITSRRRASMRKRRTGWSRRATPRRHVLPLRPPWNSIGRHDNGRYGSGGCGDAVRLDEKAGRLFMPPENSLRLERHIQGTDAR